MNSSSTSISDLPTNPLNGGNISNNISENIQLNVDQPPSQNVGTINLDQSTISQIVNGLQQASNSGATQLPSRDISMSTNNITLDQQIQPNFIPQPANKEDYIQNDEDKNEMINNYNQKIQRLSSLDEMYNEIQTPLLLSVLYFLFQLPIFKKILYTYFPILFSVDGNPTVNGYIFNSCLFGLLYYIINKFTSFFNAF